MVVIGVCATDAFATAPFYSDASDANRDNDGDGFTNLQEFEIGSHPNKADVDENNNRIPDAVEARKFNGASIPLLLLDDNEA